MGQVTRHEVAELIKKFEDTVLPKQMSLGMPGLLYAGINAVKAEFDKTQGSPSVLLRNYARVLKHYVEAPKDPRNIFYANYVITAVHNGADVTKALKRARVECDPAKSQDELRKAVKALQKTPAVAA
ncbi:hypothetical protein LUCX_14 [Xanthomonas phage vB_XciM_LucasX]|nr:hypothetical protein LUCX_14 [Xanthomonas phage vB_XciM_LucasX]